MADTSGGEPLDPEERSPRWGVKYKDLAVMEALLRHGADLAERREVVYYCYAPSRGRAEAIAEAARSRGFRVEVGDPSPDQPGTWAVLCRVTGVVSPDFVRANGDFFEELATREGAEYDGWQAAVKPSS